MKTAFKKLRKRCLARTFHQFSFIKVFKIIFFFISFKDTRPNSDKKTHSKPLFLLFKHFAARLSTGLSGKHGRPGGGQQIHFQSFPNQSFPSYCDHIARKLCECQTFRQISTAGKTIFKQLYGQGCVSICSDPTSI